MTRLFTGVAGPSLLLMPLLLPSYYLIVLSDALILAIACLGVNLLLGTTGLLSLGHAAYFGMGAYAGGFIFTFGRSRPSNSTGSSPRSSSWQPFSAASAISWDLS